MKKTSIWQYNYIASISGLVAFAGKAAYNSAKHGLIGFTRVAALEGAEYNIKVNALYPGYVDTAQVQNQLSEIGANKKYSDW